MAMRSCRWSMTVVICVLMSGCGPQVSREELGDVEFKVPSVPGTSQPYQLPDFSQPYEKAETATGDSSTDGPAG